MTVPAGIARLAARATRPPISATAPLAVPAADAVTLPPATASSMPAAARREAAPAGGAPSPSPTPRVTPPVPTGEPAAAHAAAPSAEVRTERVPVAETPGVTRTEQVTADSTREVIRRITATAPGQPREASAAPPAAAVAAPPVPPAAPPRPQAAALSAAAPQPRDELKPLPVPPVQIDRIEVQVATPPAESDPFAGCRALESGLTARRGGGW